MNPSDSASFIYKIPLIITIGDKIRFNKREIPILLIPNTMGIGDFVFDEAESGGSYFHRFNTKYSITAESYPSIMKYIISYR